MKDDLNPSLIALERAIAELQQMSVPKSPGLSSCSHGFQFNFNQPDLIRPFHKPPATPGTFLCDIFTSSRSPRSPSSYPLLAGLLSLRPPPLADSADHQSQDCPLQTGYICGDKNEDGGQSARAIRSLNKPGGCLF